MGTGKNDGDTAPDAGNNVADRTVPATLEAGAEGGVAVVKDGLPDLALTCARNEHVLAQAKRYNIEPVELDVGEEWEPDTDVLRKIPREFCELHGCLPITKTDDGRHVIIAVFDPTNLDAEQGIRMALGVEPKMVLDSEEAVRDAIAHHYDQLEGVDHVRQLSEKIQAIQAVTGNGGIDEDALRAEGQQNEVVTFVNGIIAYAVKVSASDVHIEPGDKALTVRFRVDGVMQAIPDAPRRIQQAVVSRIKIMAEMDIAERRSPQDGKIRVEIDSGRKYDFRVATAPVQYGEKVVMRLLSQRGGFITLPDIGFSEEQLATVIERIEKPQGMVLLTGPTGSGKTTTLAAMVDHLNQVTRNIMTIEEPVEIRIPGVQQVDVNRAVSLSFAAAVRNFLRMDPDVIMVGEIRDFETAEAATQAAATGHLVLSTLHTNDAAFTIERLRMMGIEPFLIGNNLSLVVAQRLARRICPSCPPVKDEVSDDVLRSLGVKPNEMKKFVARRGSGVKQRRKCLYCRGAGYKGRIPIYEMLVFTDEIKRAIFDGLTTDQVRDIARKQGMLTLREAGIERIRNGETTVEEVLRVTTE